VSIKIGEDMTEKATMKRDLGILVDDETFIDFKVIGLRDETIDHWQKEAGVSNTDLVISAPHESCLLNVEEEILKEKVDLDVIYTLGQNCWMGFSQAVRKKNWDVCVKVVKIYAEAVKLTKLADIGRGLNKKTE
jgi:hypothetical protein